MEHWDVAFNQGRAVALNMLGQGNDYDVVPYFFSDPSDWASLEYVGPTYDWDREVVRGSLDEGKFTVFYLEPLASPARCPSDARRISATRGGGSRQAPRSGMRHVDELADLSADLEQL